MINFSQLNEIQILMFGVILLRMTAFLFSAAVFSAENISIPVKVLFSLVMTLVVFNSVATNQALVRLHESEQQLLILGLREVLVGVALGFVTRIFFFAISSAGEIISMTTGLSQAQMFNPMMGGMGNAFEHFYAIIATLVYLSLDGHHLLIQGIVDSFQTIRVAELTFHVQTLNEIVLKAQAFFILGVKISAPIMVSMLVVQVGISLLSRIVPQINVLTTSSSITVLLGFVIMFISLPLLVVQMSDLLQLTSAEFFKFIKTI